MKKLPSGGFFICRWENATHSLESNGRSEVAPRPRGGPASAYERSELATWYVDSAHLHQKQKNSARGVLLLFKKTIRARSFVDAIKLIAERARSVSNSGHGTSSLTPSCGATWFASGGHSVANPVSRRCAESGTRRCHSG